MFIPLALDPAIAKDLPIQHIDEELASYLRSIQDQDNIIIGVHGYLHKSPINGDTSCEYYCENQNIPFDLVLDRVQKGIGVFKELGLKPEWIVPPGNSYDKKLLYITEYLGYIEEPYLIESYQNERKKLDFIFKKEASDKIARHYLGDHGLVFKEYTWGWGRQPIAGFDTFQKTSLDLKQDMMTSVDGLTIHIQDYQGRTETFLERALKDYQKIKFIRVDDVASEYDLPKLKKLVNLADKTDRLLFIGVIPAHSAIIGNPRWGGVIKTTWFVFIPFFLFPLAVMVPLHYWERRKIRKRPLKSSNLPKVSLILPAYNEQKLIGKSIERALSQDYEGEVEVIIIDDGSTDLTYDIAKLYEDAFPGEVKVHRHEVNKGKPEGLNTGFRIATGEISVFSDSDSHLNYNLIRLMVPHFDDPEVGMVSGMIVINNEINLLTRLQQVEYLYNQEIIRFCQHTHKGVLICPGAATAVRTQIARDIPSTETTITEDADFTFEVAKAGWKVTQEPEAISWTEAPEKWANFIDQRKRWLYGVLQTIWIHKWALFYKNGLPNLWVWWAWIGYITCPITTLAVILMPLLYWILGPTYLVFLGWYSLIIFTLYGFVTWYGLKQYVHEDKMNLIWLLPAYIIYQYLLNTLLCYLVIAFIIRKGVHVHYGGRYIHAV